MIRETLVKRFERYFHMAAVLVLLVSASACGKSPTTAIPDSPPAAAPQPAITIACSPSSGDKDTVVTVTVSIADNQQEVGVFGMDLTFPPKMLEFTGVSKGSLTGSWAAVDGNEVSAGSLKIGGFRGSGTALVKNSAGSVAVISFKVDGSSLAGGQQGQVCIKNYTDDITGIPPEPACATFTLTK